MAFESTSERYESTENFGNSVFTKMIKAGHRTYFLDVKTTRTNDYFLAITELRKKITPDGVENERNKVFIYQEDFEKFADSFSEAMEFVRRSRAAEDKNSDKK